MSWVSGHQVLELVQKEAAEVAAEEQRLAAQLTKHQQAEGEVRTALDEAWRHLLELLLPSLDLAALDAAAARVSLPALAAAEVARRAAERRTELTATIAALAADPRFVTREARLAEISLRAEELDEHIATLVQSRARLESEPVFRELIREKYGVEGYTRSWWQASYYRHWKQGDLIVERHGARLRAADFAQIRAIYLREGEALGSLRADRQRLAADAEAIEALARKHADAQAGLEGLDAWSLASARGRAREHLGGLPERDRLALFADHPALLLAAKRVGGLEAKARYLPALAEEWIRRPADEARRLRAKLEHAQAKLRGSPKKMHGRYDWDEMQAKYRAPRDRWLERRRRYDEVSHTIVVYEDYGACDHLSDYLWWDMMTGGSKGSFIPEVSAYRSSLRDPGAAAGDVAAGYGPDRDVLLVDAS